MSRDYSSIFVCLCGWRGPAYLMLVPKTMPGRIRCPECQSEQAVEEKNGR